MFGTQNLKEMRSKQFCFFAHLQNAATVPLKLNSHFLSNELSSIFSAATGQVILARNLIYFWLLWLS